MGDFATNEALVALHQALQGLIGGRSAGRRGVGGEAGCGYRNGKDEGKSFYEMHKSESSIMELVWAVILIQERFKPNE
jgi:hypothetical protein